MLATLSNLYLASGQLGHDAVALTHTDSRALLGKYCVGSGIKLPSRLLARKFSNHQTIAKIVCLGTFTLLLHLLELIPFPLLAGSVFNPEDGLPAVWPLGPIETLHLPGAGLVLVPSLTLTNPLQLPRIGLVHVHLLGLFEPILFPGAGLVGWRAGHPGPLPQVGCTCPPPRSCAAAPACGGPPLWASRP